MATEGQFASYDSSALPRYGSASLDESTPPRGGSIRWGQVIKGAAIVTGAVLVAVVGFTAGSALIGYLSGIPGMDQALAAAYHGISTVAGAAVGAAGAAWDWLALGASWLWNTGFPAAWGAIGSGASSLFGSLGFTAGLTGQELATAQKVAGGALAVTAAATVAPAVKSSLSSLHIMDPSHSSMSLGDSSASAMMSQNASSATKIAHHAAEQHSGPRASWRQRIAAASAYQQAIAGGATHAEATLAAHDGMSAAVKARNSSFAEQLNADRTAIENALQQQNR